MDPTRNQTSIPVARLNHAVLNTRLAFRASAAISRKDFRLMQELDRESGGLFLPTDIVIEINAEAIKQG